MRKTVLVHDDGRCYSGQYYTPLTKSGRCPSCNFHPDMQSTCFKEVVVDDHENYIELVKEPKIEEAKVVATCDDRGDLNGSLMELYKDGNKTIAYLTTIAGYRYKGFHLHRVREANYVCIKGKVRVDLWRPGESDFRTIMMSPGEKLYIPTNIATKITNILGEEAWIINYPNPAYDPDLKDEQVEYTVEELNQGIIK